jgi:small subunit ribosomal protein S20
MAKPTEPTKKTKRPTAEKRMIQNKKRRLINKTRKSGIRTAIRRFKEAVKAGDQAQTQEKLNAVYSLVDKAVKTGIYKKNKASRTKSRLTALAAATK